MFSLWHRLFFYEINDDQICGYGYIFPPCLFQAWWLLHAHTSQAASAFIFISLLQIPLHSQRCILSPVTFSDAAVFRTSWCTLSLCCGEEPSRVHPTVVPPTCPAHPWLIQPRLPCGVNGGVVSAVTLGFFLGEYCTYQMLREYMLSNFSICFRGSHSLQVVHSVFRSINPWDRRERPLLQKAMSWH